MRSNHYPIVPAKPTPRVASDPSMFTVSTTTYARASLAVGADVGNVSEDAVGNTASANVAVVIEGTAPSDINDAANTTAKTGHTVGGDRTDQLVVMTDAMGMAHNTDGETSDKTGKRDR